jgi:predicted CDP-diglyceride synthetase/phosphatidate cytidylyltransferase
VSDLVESDPQAERRAQGLGRRQYPGIGGVFDLSDSLLLAAPVGYFLLGRK